MPGLGSACGTWWGVDCLNSPCLGRDLGADTGWGWESMSVGADSGVAVLFNIVGTGADAGVSTAPTANLFPWLGVSLGADVARGGGSKSLGADSVLVVGGVVSRPISPISFVDAGVSFAGDTARGGESNSLGNDSVVGTDGGVVRSPIAPISCADAGVSFASDMARGGGSKSLGADSGLIALVVGTDGGVVGRAISCVDAGIFTCHPSGSGVSFAGVAAVGGGDRVLNVGGWDDGRGGGGRLLRRGGSEFTCPEPLGVGGWNDGRGGGGTLLRRPSGRPNPSANSGGTAAASASPRFSSQGRPTM